MFWNITLKKKTYPEADIFPLNLPNAIRATESSLRRKLCHKLLPYLYRYNSKSYPTGVVSATCSRPGVHKFHTNVGATSQF